MSIDVVQVLAMAFSLIVDQVSKPLRDFMGEGLSSLREKAEATDNPWDDLVVVSLIQVVRGKTATGEDKVQTGNFLVQLLAMVAGKITPEVRAELLDFLDVLSIKAGATKNPFDDKIVELLTYVFRAE